MKSNHIADLPPETHALAERIGPSIPLHPDHPLRRELGAASEKTLAARMRAYESLREEHGHEAALDAARQIIHVG